MAARPHEINSIILWGTSTNRKKEKEIVAMDVFSVFKSFENIGKTHFYASWALCGRSFSEKCEFSNCRFHHILKYTWSLSNPENFRANRQSITFL